jgi:hypothetical protein
MVFEGKGLGAEVRFEDEVLFGREAGKMVFSLFT